MEYNLKITTDDSELQSTQDLLVEIGDTANELQGEVEDAFNSEPVEEFNDAVDESADALKAAEEAARRAAEEQKKLNNETSKGTKGNKRLGSSLLTNALRMAGFGKEARVAGAALNILNKVSLKGILRGIKTLAVSTKNLLVGGVRSLITGFVGLAAKGANAFKTLALSANSASKIIKLALVSTGIGALVVGVGLLIANFDKVQDAVSRLGGTFSFVFGKAKELIVSTIELSRDLLSSITGGLIDSAERAAERAAQIAREANREVLESEKDRAKQVTALIESETALALKSAKERGAAQAELDKISIEGNKKKAEFLDVELKKQKEIVDALNLEIIKQADAAKQDEDTAKARAKAQNELLKANAEVNKIQKQIAQTAIDNANIVQSASDREKAAIKAANDERLRASQLESDRLSRLERLNDVLLRSTKEVLVRQAEEEKKARDKEIEEVAKSDEEKIKLKEANQELLNNRLLEIDQSFEQKRIDLEREIFGDTLQVKLDKVDENQKKIEDRIRESYTIQGKLTERGEELIKESIINAKNEKQELLNKASENEEKAEKKRINKAIKVATDEIELQKQLALNKLNVSRGANETREEFERRAAKERERIAIESEVKILEKTLEINTQLTKEERELIKARIASKKILLVQGEEDAAEAVDKAPNPFDFRKKLEDGLKELGFDDAQASAAIDAAKQVAQQLVDVYVAAADARLKAAEELVEFRNDNIEELNDQLDREIEKNKLGLASNIEKIEEEIAREKELRDQALAEQEKAARKKQQIETAVQAANLLSAVAQLYATLASAGPPGIAAATVISAAMIAAFVASRVQVAKATQPQKKRKGGLVDGKSHEGGGVKYYSNESSNVVELEGNEFVTPVKQTKKHLKFLEAMRHGAFDNMDLMHAINNPKTLNSMNDSIVYYNLNRDSSNNANVVAAINRAANINNRGLQDLQDRPTVYESNGYLYREVNKNGNKTVTKIKIN